ncbi:hypothetical protein JCM10213_004491 [Rhodosporidiobolus nylandii]
MALPDVHPDGDPFAAQDAARASSSLLGRMEQRALAEAHLDGLRSEQGTPTRPGFAPPKPATAAAASVGKPGEIVIDSSDEEPEARMTGDEGEGGSGDEDEDDEDGSGTEVDGEGDGEGDVSEIQGEGDGAGAEDDDDEDDSDDDDSDDDSSSTASGPVGAKKAGADGDVEMGEAGAAPKSPAKAGGEGAKDGDAATADGAAPAEKEKKKRRRRRASPSPPPIVPKPPQPTIRLEIVLPPRKGGEVPEINIIELARAKGLIPPEEEKKAEDDAESESDGQGGRRKVDKGKGKAMEDASAAAGENGVPPKKKRKRGPNVVLGRFGGYDTTDPFVDDDEVELYEPRFYAKPRRDGYFIQTGEVEVAPRKGRAKGSKNKPKVDENGNPVPTAPSRRKSNKVVVGQDGKPVDPAHAGPSGEAPGAPSFGAAGPPAVPARKPGEFSAELQEDLDMLRRESAKESWIVKNKFPPELRNLLTSVAYHALDLGEYGDDFFAVMPKIFPYNLFTMKKLIKREVFSKRIDDMNKQQEQLLGVLKKGIADSLAQQQADFARKRSEWERAQLEGGGAGSGFGGAPPMQAARKTPEPMAPGFGEASPAIRTPMLGGAADGADGSPAPGKDEDKGQAEPKWRFRFNDAMRHALYYACDIEDQKSELITEKQTLEKATTRAVNPEKEHSAKNARKALYQTIVDFWPRDLMNTNQISREISNYRLKLKRSGELPSTKVEDTPAPAAAT